MVMISHTPYTDSDSATRALCDVPCPASSQEDPPLGIRLEQLARANIPVAAAITKIHRLKQIRYTLHWKTGDLLWETIARLIDAHSGMHSWTIAYDSAEFLTIMPDCMLEVATHHAHTWQKAIEHYPWNTIHPALQVRITTGVAAQSPLVAYETLLTDVEAALRCNS